MNQDSTRAKWTKAHLQGGKKVKLECMYLITICGLEVLPLHWMGVGEGGAAEPGSYIIYSLCIYIYIYKYVYIYIYIYVCVYVNMYVYTCVSVCIYVCMYVHCC